ncbi:uncharacterized protein SCHCODRAFT_02702895 [Schizophyllum commune H4-8]|uniref:uncharacterized protein n=1 Tax=Schizophyllum commune (strain H4-8 / FGSC 9210) TaxID=578458 RepID=UPI00215EA2A9|nr:uncharacterized protein SCHCODRAFT_02702895 [Schizophyllum commune H4-8]KAI5890309.1 hypothetical protein SCHCODRAFT_02702895 [Schizophyllum commune H4-8]
MSGLLRCRGCGTIYQDSSSYTSHVQRCEQTAQSTQDALKNIRAPAMSRRRGIAAFASSENLGAFKEKMKNKASKVQKSLKRARRDSDWGDGGNDARYSTRQSSASKSTFSSAALASDSVNELSAGPSKQRASRSSIALSATSGPPPPSSSPPPPSFCSNMDIDSCEQPLAQPPPGRAPSPAPSIQPPDEHGRARRKWRPSARIRLALSDRLPEGPGQLLQRLDQAVETRVEENEQALPTPSLESVPRRVILHVHERVKTTANRFGLSRIYRRQPASRIPDSDLSFEQRVDVPIPEIRRQRRSITDIIYPYPNITSFLFGRHHEKMSTSGARARREDNRRMLLDDRFNPTDLCDVDFDKIDKLLAEDVQSPHGGSGWRTSSVVINVPTGAKESAAARDDNRRHTAAMRRHALDLGEGTRDAFVPYTLEGVCTRSLVHIMRSVLTEDPSSVDFHWHPYSEHWTPPYESMAEEQVMGELYASQSFRDAERDLLASPPEPGCDLPRVIFALMFWSDATHVAQVGNSKVWPGYAFIGNQSMYMRSKPSSRAAHHFVYFPMTFGRDTIRRFAHNVSELSRMAARDYEDILLCIIPCLEGLLPDAHEKSVLDLLYIATYWHSLAKLRMHTSSTVKILNDLTTELGKALRHFADITCSNFCTVETDKEYQARKRAEAKRTTSTKDTGNNTMQTSGKRTKGFSLRTIKLHFLGDAVDAIRRYGSLEHISTKTGELEHRVVKKRRARTSNTNVIPQLARLETRERVHDRMYEELQALDDEEKHRPSKRKRVIPSSELLPHHRISHNETGQRLYLETWLPDKHADPAFKSFIVKLKSHLLGRLQGLVLVDDQPEYTDTELAAVEIQNDRLFSHSTASINFTTYDVRRDSDLVHVPPLGLHDGEEDDPMRHRDVMVHTTDDIKTYPFMYARTLMIFHAKVRLGGRGEWHSVEFLWIIRGCHLIPAFHYRRTTDLLGPSLCRDSRHGDWSKYYVGRFVDRDMMMRYLGLGVGHLNTPDFPHEIFERARFDAAAVPIPGDTQATYTEEADEDVELDYESDGVAVGSDDEL